MSNKYDSELYVCEMAQAIIDKAITFKKHPNVIIKFVNETIKRKEQGHIHIIGKIMEYCKDLDNKTKEVCTAYLLETSTARELGAYSYADLITKGIVDKNNCEYESVLTSALWNPTDSELQELLNQKHIVGKTTYVINKPEKKEIPYYTLLEKQKEINYVVNGTQIKSLNCTEGNDDIETPCHGECIGCPHNTAD